MKLRTKIVLIANTFVILAILLTDILVYRISAEGMFDEALQAAYVESSEVFSNFQEYSMLITGDLSKSLLKYYFQSNKDEYTVCLKESEEYYNRTVLSPEELERGNFIEYKGISYKKQKALGNDILIFKSEAKNVDVYRIINVTHVFNRLHTLVVSMIIISLVVVSVTALLLNLVIKRTLSSLVKLSDAVGKIAGGAYHQRVDIKTSDEIGQLAKDFNEMANSIEAHTKEIEEEEAKKTLFMGNLTHELKTPLTAISGYAQTLRTIDLNEEDRMEALTYIYEESKRLDRLSKKMMRLLELGETSQIAKEKFPVKKLFAASVKACEYSAVQKNITLETDVVEQSIECDFDLMCDVLINLIDNAIQASENGSKIVVSASDKAITVTDYGRGIPKDKLSKITDPFFMVDKSRSRKNGGSGLGLSLVKTVLKCHGMKLEIKSEEGKGTVVSIKI